MSERSLCFPIKNEIIYLGRKKRGFGKDKINGFGGKVDKEEPIEDAALRELYEESNLKGYKDHLIKYGEIEFFFPETKKDWDQKVHIYILNTWEGEPKESEEMTVEKYKINQIPYNQMWDTDQYWLPHILKGNKIKAKFWFKEDGNTTDKYEILNVNSFN